MSNTMKWIIRILAGLGVLFFVVVVGYVVISYFYGSAWASGYHVLRIEQGERVFPRNNHPWGLIPMRPDRVFSGGILRGFFPFGGFTGLLFCLGFLILLATAAVASVLIFTRSKNPVVVAAPGGPTKQAAEPVEIPAPSTPCPNCQLPVAEGWNHCPYCGTDLTPLP